MNGPSKRRFDEIFSEGKRVQGRFCRLSALTGSGKVGYATSRKIGCKAKRNRQRRRFQAAVREIDPIFEPQLDLVVIISPAAEGVEIAEINMELAKLLEAMKGRWVGESECS